LAAQRVDQVAWKLMRTNMVLSVNRHNPGFPR
jgi:hypothetical protein